MDILSYLATLIQTNNEVGVPGLGTFLKKKSPGRYDAGLHAFVPPSYQLVFHPEVTETGLLAEYISKEHNLSEASADYHIDKFVAKTQQKLNDELEADMDPLGKLMLSGRLITFLPNDHLNLGHQFFGLPAVREENPMAVEPGVVEETPADDVEQLEAIVAENSLEEENPGQLPEESIYVAEPAELVEEALVEEEPITPVEETSVTEEEPVVAAKTIVEVTPVDEAAVNDKMPAEDLEKLEAIVIENSIEEENPGTLPEEPIYIAEPTELVEEAPLEEQPVVEQTPVVVPPVIEERPRVNLAAVQPEEKVNYQIEEQPKATTPTYYKVVIVVLFLLCLAFVLYMLSPEWFRKTNKVVAEPEQTTVPIEEKPTVVLPDTLGKQQDTLPQNATQVDTSVMVPPVTKKPAVTQTVAAKTVAAKTVVAKPAKPAVISYEVIASSVYGDKAAQQFIASMKRTWGINAKIVSKLPGKKIKISVGSYKDEKTARLERARLEQKLEIPGLYIYTNTNKPD